MPTTTGAVQRCIDPRCGATFPTADTLVACRACGKPLDVHYTFAGDVRGSLGSIAYTPGGGYGDPDSSGVWRFRRLMPFFSTPKDIATIGEGRTILQRADLLGAQLGFAPGGGGGGNGGLYLQYEGLNPSGSFKDNGMTAAFTHARMVGAKVCACASTGNTSASMAVYAAQAGMKAVVFIGEGKIAYGKLAQALDYGALTLQVAGDFDACLARVRHIAENVPRAGVYLMNSVNPFRLEGQKAVMYRVMEGLGWKVPDWVIVPGGNLGNCSAFGKAFMELLALGVVDRVPRLAVINAAGARTLDTVYNKLGVRWNGGGYFHDGGAAKVEQEYARMDAAAERASTIASAIEINRPVNLAKALRALEVMNGRGTSAHDPSGGVVRAVDDDTIRHYKAMVGAFGFGCEPASAASVAGASLLLQEGVIRPDQTVACVLTGHGLKDPDITVAYHTGMATKPGSQPVPTERPDGKWANPPVRVADNLQAILAAMGVSSGA